MKFKHHIIATTILSTLTLTGCEGGEDGNKDTTPAKVSINETTKITEPESGELTYFVDVSLNKKALKNGSVDYELRPSSALDGSEFLAQTGTLDIIEGERDYTIGIILLGDDLDEEDETFHITLTNPVNVTLDNDEGAFTVVDSDPTPTVSFEVLKGYVSEGNADYSITLNLTNGSERGINIPFELSGIATANQDYTLLTPSPIEIESGQTSVVISFDIIDDSIQEGGESIVVSLGSPLNAELTEEITATIIIPGDLNLTDTGVSTFYDGTTYLAAKANSSYPRQDAEFGFDADATDHIDGSHGLSYTKIDRHGNALPSNASPYENDSAGHRCIRDETTGLTWETKMTVYNELPTVSGEELKEHINDELDALDSQPFRYAPAQAAWQSNYFAYFWYNSDGDTNGGDSGTKGEDFSNTRYPVNQMCAFPNEYMINYSSVKNCSTEEYAKKANTFNMCGFTDWRLPTSEELRSIHNYSAAGPDDNATNYFDDNAPGDYFTSSPSSENSGSVWCMSSDSGQMKLCNKLSANQVRLVRGDSE